MILFEHHLPDLGCTIIKTAEGYSYYLDSEDRGEAKPLIMSEPIDVTDSVIVAITDVLF